MIWGDSKTLSESRTIYGRSELPDINSAPSHGREMIEALLGFRQDVLTVLTKHNDLGSPPRGSPLQPKEYRLNKERSSPVDVRKAHRTTEALLQHTRSVKHIDDRHFRESR